MLSFYIVIPALALINMGVVAQTQKSGENLRSGVVQRAIAINERRQFHSADFSTGTPDGHFGRTRRSALLGISLNVDNGPPGQSAVTVEKPLNGNPNNNLEPSPDSDSDPMGGSVEPAGDGVVGLNVKGGKDGIFSGLASLLDGFAASENEEAQAPTPTQNSTSTPTPTQDSNTSTPTPTKIISLGLQGGS